MFADDDGVETPLFGWLSTPAGLIASVAVLLWLLLVAVVAALLIRHVIRQRLPATAASLERGVMQWRTQALPPGPRRQLAVLRLQLRDALAATDRQLAALPALALVAALPLLASQLTTAARRVDQRLQTLGREPDDERLSASLPMLQHQVSEVRAALGLLRGAACAATVSASNLQLAALRDRVELEVARVRFGIDYLNSQRDTDR